MKKTIFISTIAAILIEFALLQYIKSLPFSRADVQVTNDTKPFSLKKMGGGNILLSCNLQLLQI